MVRDYLRGLLRRARGDRLDGGPTPPAPAAPLTPADVLRVHGVDAVPAGRDLRDGGDHAGALTRAPGRLLLLQVDGTPGFPARGVAGLGVVVRRADGTLLRVHTARAAAATCNEAEYEALIAGLELLRRTFAGAPARCLTDSRVVVDQLSGRAAVRAGALAARYVRARALISHWGAGQIELVAIPRELNRLADALAWEALGGRRGLVRFGAQARSNQMKGETV
ncbi:MAG: reverse transcriptase-like protein [Chloroflexales bacterium]